MSKNNKSTDVEQLIDAVKEYPVLYSRLGVVNNNEKNLAWQDIAKKFNDEDPKQLKQKWRNLKDSFQKAVKYKKDLEEVGQLAKYHPYRHEKQMSFLLPHIDIPARKRRLKTYEDNEDCKSEKLYKKSDSINYGIESQDVEYLVEDIVFSDMKRNENDDEDNIIYKDSREIEDEIEQNNTADILETESNICYEEVESCTDMPETEMPSKRIDDLDAWISSVQAQMLKLTKINRARAKRDINTILSNYEIEQYEAEG